MDEQVLKLLSKEYPNIKAASAEIINLNAILALPKGTEFFLSDLHGEHEAFIHMIKSASGVIATKIDEIYGEDMTEAERDEIASLVYNADAEIKRKQKVLSQKEYDAWCRQAIYHLIEIARACSLKYTRKKVRRRLPEYAAYSMDELMHARDEENKAKYYSEIINSIIECRMAEDYIVKAAETVHRLAVDKLHIIGDIFDRGAHPDKIMDFLIDYHDVDIQWGNHDIVWMGAATGNWACIANVLRMNISYNNFDMLEVGYGINLRPLASFAQKYYGDDRCEAFWPHIIERNKYDQVDEGLAAKMHKVIAILQFKIEGHRIKNHPEYHLENRLLLDKIDFEKGTVTVKGQEYELKDTNLPTIDPEDPYRITDEEKEMMAALEASFTQSEKLQRHIRFLYTHGGLYTICNGNLLFHGCIPIDEEGNFKECEFNGKILKGKALMDYLDEEVRTSYFSTEESEETGRPGDIMWYLWLGSESPLFGKDQMTTFERLFIADKKTHKEYTKPYYRFRDSRETCEMILEEFGLSPRTSHILNGHVPVKFKDGESPIKGEGKLFVIDGGISKAYQKTTGIAGYTFIYNSRSMALAEHKPYEPLKEDGTQKFYRPIVRNVENLRKRMTVRDTDSGVELEAQIERLKALVEAYRRGFIKEVY